MSPNPVGKLKKITPSLEMKVLGAYIYSGVDLIKFHMHYNSI